MFFIKLQIIDFKQKQKPIKTIKRNHLSNLACYLNIPNQISKSESRKAQE
jgi:hypothetical protein